MSGRVEETDALPQHPAPAGDARRVPDFFLAGQPKSGTTSLYRMLRAHPEVFMPELKEPQFLCSDLRWRRPPEPWRPQLPTTMAEYLALFADAAPGQRIGEASGAYLFSHTAAAAIAELNERARVVVIFREPTAFLRSLHLQLVKDGQENVLDLRRALALEEARARGDHVPRRAYRPRDLAYSEHLRYTEQLERMHAALGRDQVLVLLYDDYRRDNATAFSQVLEFIGVDASFPAPEVEANPALLVRSQAASSALHRVSIGYGPASKALKAGLKAVVPTGARRRMLRGAQAKVHVAPAPLDDALSHELRAMCRPEVERFSEYLGRDLVSEWGYG